MAKKFDAKLQRQVCSLLDRLGIADESQQDFLLEVLSLHGSGSLEKKLSEFNFYLQNQERETEVDSVAESAYIAYNAAKDLIINAKKYKGKVPEEIGDLPVQYWKTIRQFSEEMKRAARTSEDEKRDEYLSVSKCGFEYFKVIINIRDSHEDADRNKSKDGDHKHSNRLKPYLDESYNEGHLNGQCQQVKVNNGSNDKLIQKLTKINDDIAKSREELTHLKSSRKKDDKTMQNIKSLYDTIQAYQSDFNTVVGEFLGKISPEHRALTRNFINDYFASRQN